MKTKRKNYLKIAREDLSESQVKVYKLEQWGRRLQRELADIAAGLVNKNCTDTWDMNTKLKYTAVCSLLDNQKPV